MRSRVPFTAAVLAGGRSSRMGADKSFAEWNGVRLIDHQLATLRALGPTELLISGRRGVDYGVPRVRVVLDATPDQGPLGGLAAIMDAATTPLTLVLAIDMPEITSSFLQRLLDHSSPGKGTVACSPRGWEPLAAVYPSEVLPLIRPRFARTELRVIGLVEDALRNGWLSSIKLDEHEAKLFTNVNSPADLPSQQGGSSTDGRSF